MKQYTGVLRKHGSGRQRNRQQVGFYRLSTIHIGKDKLKNVVAHEDLIDLLNFDLNEGTADEATFWVVKGITGNWLYGVKTKEECESMPLFSFLKVFTGRLALNIFTLWIAAILYTFVYEPHTEPISPIWFIAAALLFIYCTWKTIISLLADIKVKGYCLSFKPTETAG